MKYCIICNSELTGKQNKYCSGSCKAKGHYDNIKNQTNSTYSQFKRGFTRKLALVYRAGGKCKECGYNENVAALEFHHQHDKKFPLDTRNLSNRKWEDILIEADKCVLMCGRCHTEHHNPQLKMSLLENEYGAAAKKLLEDVRF